VAKAQRGAGITGIKMHDLRHYFASGLIAAGCDVVTVQRAGSLEATTTLKHLRTPVAERGGPYSQRGSRPDGVGARQSCGHCADKEGVTTL
jgi:integrase